MSRDLAAASAAVDEAISERCAGDGYCSGIDHELDSASADADTDGKITEDLLILI